jgi:hypothetical protein
MATSARQPELNMTKGRDFLAQSGTKTSEKRRTRLMLAAITFAAILWAPRVLAQGCEPIRYTMPVRLGGEGDAYQASKELQLTLAYRRLVSKDWFVGTEQNSSLAPGGQSPVFRIHTLVADVAYALTDRIRLNASLPFSKGSLSATYPDGAVHEQHATGIGDLSVVAEAWLAEPRSHAGGNVAVGLGFKAPTGSHTKESQYYTASGPVPFPADQTIQPGDGGWSALVHAKAFKQMSERSHVYGFGSYMVSPKARSNVERVPGSGLHWSVPDVYSAKAGAALSVLPDRGLSVSLGGRIDGIPVRDLIGGGDDSTVKRASYVVFADPGLSLSIGQGTMTLSVPWRLMVNRKKSLFEERTNALNAGGFAKYLMFLAYSYRL